MRTRRARSAKLREDTLGLTLEHKIQRCRLQDLVILEEPQQALIAINLPCPSDDCSNLRSRSLESPELLDLALETGDVWSMQSSAFAVV